MFPYKTNAPYYFDYLASVKSRQEIEEDPDLCVYLKNPYIVDNMEMAIRYREAKYGDYQAKYDFLEYFMCNGPELDADTILHYRAKCFRDPVMMEIAYSYFSGSINYASLREKRKNKYQKAVDDCFNNPCFYLGYFSPQMGKLGDKENTYGIFSWMANHLKSNGGETRQAEVSTENQVLSGQISDVDAALRVKNAKDSDEKNKDKQGDGNIRPDASGNEDANQNRAPNAGDVSKSYLGLIPPAIQKGWNAWWKDVVEGTEDFSNEILQSTQGITNSKRIGDWMSSKISENFDIITKGQVRRQLGDCARMWSQVRRLNIFSPSQNTHGTMNASQIQNNTTPQGTKITSIANASPSVNEASATIAKIHEAKNEIMKK